MKKLSILLVCMLLVAVLVTLTTSAQKLELFEKTELYDKEHIPKKDPIPYPFIKEADVMWEKTVWRRINLREKMNHPLYYPDKPIGNRKNLISTLMDAVKEPVEGHPVFAYKTLLQYEFEQPISYAEVITGFKVDSIVEPQIDSLGNRVMVLTQVDIQKLDVTSILVKEKWFFDKKHSSLGVRIIGLCPLRVYPRMLPNALTGMDEPTGEILQQPVFWVYYPEVRWYLSRQEAFNTQNDAQSISFDDLFHQRKFSSYIYKESNVFENRRVDKYAKGMDTMFEAERIKESIRTFEHDLWEF
jgi:gliding motility associated protien GldN